MRSMSRFQVFPVGPFGSSSTTKMRRGYLYASHALVRPHDRRSSGDAVAVPEPKHHQGSDLLAEPPSCGCRSTAASSTAGWA